MKTALIWFENNLRIADNKALSSACKENEKVIATFFFDPRKFTKDKFGFKKTEKFRAQFLIESIEQLQESLKKLNIPLLIYTAKPEDKIAGIIEKYKITSVYCQKEWTAEEKKVRKNIYHHSPKNIIFKSYFSQFLFHPEDIPYQSFKEIPQVFTNFRKKCEANTKIRNCYAIPEKQATEHYLEEKTKIPSLEELGLSSFKPDSRSAFPFKGGENSALKRMQNYFWETENLAEYKQTRNGLLGENYSSKFSAWLANGSISPKTIYWEIKKFEEKVKKNKDTYWLIFELTWRDFFKFTSLKHGKDIFKIGGILQKELHWNKDPQAKKRWMEGKTKYDFVNANMKEIAKTGFMSNRGRQNVCSFWSKELKQDWRIGAAYFESMLVDYDVHSNWGNWMYNSGVGNDPRDRKFNITTQANRYDPDNEFVNEWLKTDN